MLQQTKDQTNNFLLPWRIIVAYMDNKCYRLVLLESPLLSVHVAYNCQSNLNLLSFCASVHKSFPYRINTLVSQSKLPIMFLILSPTIPSLQLSLTVHSCLITLNIPTFMLVLIYLFLKCPPATH